MLLVLNVFLYVAALEHDSIGGSGGSVRQFVYQQGADSLGFIVQCTGQISSRGAGCCSNQQQCKYSVFEYVLSLIFM